MTFRIRSRAEWQAQPPVKVLKPWGSVLGGVQHYIGGDFDDLPTVERSAAKLRNLQRSAFNEGYSDIEYNFAVDGSGNCWELRGWLFQSGANGTTFSNNHDVAVLYMDDADEPSDIAKSALVWIWQQIAARYSLIRSVKPHSAVKPTACPGNPLRAFIPHINTQLHPAPPTTPPAPDEDDMNRIVASPQPPTPGRVAFAELLTDNTVYLANGARVLADRLTPYGYVWEGAKISAYPVTGIAALADGSGFVVTASDKGTFVAKWRV